MTVSRGMLMRGAFSAVLVVSWLVMLYYAWRAFSTLPSPERLEHSRMARIPTLGAVGWLVLRSGTELVVMTALAWPARRRYATRLAFTVVLLPIWFVVTTPLTLTIMEWVHRRWLAGVWLALVCALLVAIAAGVVARRRNGAGTAVQS